MSKALDPSTLLATLGVESPAVAAVSDQFAAWGPVASVAATIMLEQDIRVLGIEGSQGSGKRSASGPEDPPP